MAMVPDPPDEGRVYTLRICPGDNPVGLRVASVAPWGDIPAGEYRWNQVLADHPSAGFVDAEREGIGKVAASKRGARKRTMQVWILLEKNKWFLMFNVVRPRQEIP